MAGEIFLDGTCYYFHCGHIATKKDGLKVPHRHGPFRNYEQAERIRDNYFRNYNALR